ncbi:MAG: DUF1877 family protein [Polyangiaceae bacterium]
MTARGVHFAISPEMAQRFQAAEGDDDTLLELVEELEEAWDKHNLAESDKAWDAMHRCLTDGELLFGNGEPPLNSVVLGPRQLCDGDDYIICLALADEVAAADAAIRDLDEAWFRHRYETVCPRDYAPEYGEQDRDYTWSYFKAVRELFLKAAQRGQAVVFTVDQ